MTDAQLLADFAANRSERAFEELVRNHAGMVHSVCLRILGDAHAAEDAAQAVFLVLARRAGSLPRGSSVSGWLYRTAELTARDARKRQARRARHERAFAAQERLRPRRREATMVKDSQDIQTTSWEQVAPELDAALAALPGRQQEAIVLRYFRGMNESQAAAELGVTRQAVADRLGSGLERLRTLLARRGVTAPGAVLSGLLAEHAVSPAPAALTASMQTVCLGKAAASPSALSLAEGTMKAMTIAKVKLAAAVVAAVLAVGGGGSAVAIRLAASAGEPSPRTPLPAGEGPGVRAERKGPLAGLPSAPGPTVEKIKALGDNQWVDLGAPAPDPKWGKARGRAWGAQALVLAPELRGAFLFGEGMHGFVKPDGHVMDDLWFYDIGAHRWLCLHPGTDTKTFSQRVRDGDLKCDDLGRVVNREGLWFPVETHVHAWGFLAYDTDRRKLACFGSQDRRGPSCISKSFLAAPKDMEPGVDLLEQQWKGKTIPAKWSPFFYDTLTGRFELQPATGSPGRAILEFPLCVYVPGSKRFFMAGSAGVATYDPADRSFATVEAKGSKPDGYDISGCYDSRRNRIYLATQTMHAYDIDSRTWIDLKATGTKPTYAANRGRCTDTNRISVQYDPLNDTVVAIRFAAADEDPDHGNVGVFAYSPETNSWTGPFPFPADARARGGVIKFGKGIAANTCYDRELNAWFCHVADDSNDNGTMWVYRYKRAAEKK